MTNVALVNDNWTIWQKLRQIRIRKSKGTLELSGPLAGIRVIVLNRLDRGAVCVTDAGRFDAESPGWTRRSMRKWRNRAPTTLFPLLQCNRTHKTAPAKGAMAFRSASLYWCAWNGASRPRRWRASQSPAGGNMNKLILAAASVAALALAGPASAQSPLVVKLSHAAASSTPKSAAAD